MSIITTVINNAIKLPEGVHLPDGTLVRIEVVKPTTIPLTPPTEPIGEPRNKTIAERFSKYIGVIKDGPGDGADNHDHYASGAPKRNL